MKNQYLLYILLIFGLITSCRKDFEFTNFDYKTFNRIVGPKGGTINYYANYDNDKKNNVIVKMEVPAKALDSLMVFNMYEFEDYEVTTQMEEGFARFGSKLLYFVPFYESEGYHERGQLELNYHLSVKFNQPITVTYYPLADYSDLSLKSWQEVELYNNYYKSTNKSYKVYRIKIPKLDEWGEDNNIYVNWTYQGYPNGYDRTDLAYVVSGRWTAGSDWGKGEISMANWELVGEYVLNATSNFVTFKIYDTDYLYVVARDIYLPVIPPAIVGYVSANFQTLGIQRASYDEKLYKVYLSDKSVAVFDRFLVFQYRTNDEMTYSDLPTPSQAYIKRFYSSDPVKNVTFKQDGTTQLYEVLLNSGLRLYFDALGSYAGKYIYGMDPTKLPSASKTYLQTNHKGEFITNVSYDSLNISHDTSFIAKYVVYLNTNTKVRFWGDGTWFETRYDKLDADKLPPTILTYFSTNFPNLIFSEINFTKSIETAFYNIFTVDGKWFYFGGAGKLWQYEIRNFPENNLPALVKAYLSNSFPQKTITEIIHRYDNGVESFEIYFADLTDIILSPDGTRLGK